MRIRTIAMMTLTAMATSVAMAVTPTMFFPMEINSDHEVTELVSGNTYSVRGQHGLNLPGVEGNGLRTDGYSSYIQVPMSGYALSNQTLTISLWTACQTYPMMQMDAAANLEGAIISCLDATKKEGFAFFLYSQGTYGFKCYVNGQQKTLFASSNFPKYKWVNLTATIDGTTGSIVLYQNGEQVATSNQQGTINLPTGNLYIGKSVTDKKSGQFMLNTYNGIIDELNIYNEVLTADQVAQSVESQKSKVESESVLSSINVPISHFHKDITRPRHHAMPASNWMNESHGLAYSGGRYHLFFQKNGNGPYMSRLHWGHVSSEDLCNWTEEPIAIAPGRSYDIKGCWSGCVFTDEAITGNQPWILYTGVDNGRATIDLATPADDSLIIWNKATQNPVINGTPSGYSADFRDPYFFRSGNDAYCIVGTSKDGVASTSLHKYNAETQVFDYVGYPFFTGTNVSQCGSFFEMPNITPMGDGQWLFTATPLGTSQGVRTIYYVGGITDEGTFFTSQDAPLTVELPGLAKEGYGLLSPTILQKDGKTIALGIVPDKLSSSTNYSMGWAHTLSFPREWSIDAQGELVQKPYEGLKNLRSDNHVSLEPQTLNGDLSLSPIEGREIEVEAVFTVSDSQFGIKILQNEEGKACKIYYWPAINKFAIDCSAIGRLNNDGGVFGGVYSSVLPATVAQGETMKIHLFFDHSVLDVFINDRWATSVRIFPTSTSATGVSVYAVDNTELQSLNAWTMIPAEGDEMPDALETVSSHPANACDKFILDGQLLITRNGKTYNMSGVEL